MARTRSKGAAAPAAKDKKTKASQTTSNSTSVYALAEEPAIPPQLFVLPKKATSQARIVTLQNPRYSKSTRYLVCPETGFYEFTKIASPKASPRSWLLETCGKDDGSDAQLAKDAEIFIASPIDPLFLVLPALAPIAAKKRMFLSSDDHFDSVAESSGGRKNHLSEILTWPGDALRRILEQRMAAVCDTVEAGDEQMFRLNESKLLDEILAKAKRMSEKGLPKSMEEKFVTKALEAPILGIRTQPVASSAAKPEEEGDSQSSLKAAESTDSQSTTTTTAPALSTSSTSLSEASTAATSVDGSPAPTVEMVSNAMTASPEITALQRLRVAFNFICASYLPPHLTTLLKTQLTSSSSTTSSMFTPLDEYLTKLAKLRQEALAARATTDYSRKRGLGDDEEEDARAEKRRKQAEEEKLKKASQSRGVKQLAKVDTKGMKKMSDFFKKK